MTQWSYWISIDAPEKAAESQFWVVDLSLTLVLGLNRRVNKCFRRRKNKNHALAIFLDVKPSQQHNCLIPKQATMRGKGLVHAGAIETLSAIRIVRSDVAHTQSESRRLHQYRQNDRWSIHSRPLWCETGGELKHTWCMVRRWHTG